MRWKGFLFLLFSGITEGDWKEIAMKLSILVDNNTLIDQYFLELYCMLFENS